MNATLSIDSKLWRIRCYHEAYAHITQRASGAVRTIMRSRLPDDRTLGAMNEQQFDSICRVAFHRGSR